MRPIEQFFFTIDQRITTEIAEHRQQHSMLRFALIATSAVGALLGVVSIMPAARSWWEQ